MLFFVDSAIGGDVFRRARLTDRSSTELSGSLARRGTPLEVTGIYLALEGKWGSDSYDDLNNHHDDNSNMNKKKKRSENDRDNQHDDCL